MKSLNIVLSYYVILKVFNVVRHRSKQRIKELMIFISVHNGLCNFVARIRVGYVAHDDSATTATPT